MIPKFDALFWPFLKTCAELEAGGKKEIPARTITDRLAEHFQLSAEERKEMIPSGSRTRFADRVG